MALPTYSKSISKTFTSARLAPLSMRPEASYVDLSSLNQVTDTVIGLAKEAKQRNDSIWALTQMSELREQSNIHQLESQQTYVPGSGGYVDGELRYYDDNLDNRIKSAPSKEAAHMLRMHSFDYRSSVAQTSVAYEFDTKMRKQVDDFNTALDKNTTAVYHNPQTIWKVMNETVNSVEFMSLPKDKQASAIRDIKEKLSLANISSRMDKLDESDNLQAKLAGYQALDKELDSGKWDKYIQFSDFEKAQKATGSKISQIKDKIEQRRLAALAMEAAELQTEMEDDIASLQDSGQGVINPDRVKYLATQLGRPQMYSNYMKARGQALKINGIMSKFDSGDTGAAVEMMEKLKPTPGSKGYASNMKLYNQVGTMISNRANVLASDPAAITLSNPSVINRARVSEADGIKASVAQQQRFGIQPENFRILTNSQAKSMAAQLNMAGPEQAKQLLASWEKKYNFQVAPGMNAMSRVQNELVMNGLNPNYAIINSYKNSPISNDLINASKVGYANLKKNLPTGVTDTKIKAAVKLQTDNFNKAVILSTGRGDAAQPLVDSATTLAMHYLETGRATNYMDAAKMASRGLVNDFYTVNESRKNRNYNYYIPKTIGTYTVNNNKVYDNLNYLQNKKKIYTFLNSDNSKNDLMKATPGSTTIRNQYGIYSNVPGLSQKFTKEQVSVSAASRGVWVNNTDGSGVYLGVELTGNQGVIPILDDKGRKYEFKFKDLSERDFR